MFCSRAPQGDSWRLAGQATQEEDRTRRGEAEKQQSRFVASQDEVHVHDRLRIHCVAEYVQQHVRHFQTSLGPRSITNYVLPKSTRFDGRVVARLPFQPISWIQGLSHRNLPGEDYYECSFIFLYILCTMSVRQNIQKMLGFAPSRAAAKQGGGLFGTAPGQFKQRLAVAHKTLTTN